MASELLALMHGETPQATLDTTTDLHAVRVVQVGILVLTGFTELVGDGNHLACVLSELLPRNTFRPKDLQVSTTRNDHREDNSIRVVASSAAFELLLI